MLDPLVILQHIEEDKFRIEVKPIEPVYPPNTLSPEDFIEIYKMIQDKKK